MKEVKGLKPMALLRSCCVISMSIGSWRPAPPGGSGDREPVSPGQKQVDDLDTRRSKSSHSHLPVVKAVSNLYPSGCGETNGNGQADVASTLQGVVKLTGMGSQKLPLPCGETNGNGQARNKHRRSIWLLINHGRIPPAASTTRLFMHQRYANE